jgi:hypothetical protein
MRKILSYSEVKSMTKEEILSEYCYLHSLYYVASDWANVSGEEIAKAAGYDDEDEEEDNDDE